MLYEYALKSNKFTPGDLCFIRLVSKAIIAVFTIGDEIQELVRQYYIKMSKVNGFVRVYFSLSYSQFKNRYISDSAERVIEAGLSSSPTSK